MSSAGDHENPAELAPVLLSLLKEYARRIRKISERARGLEKTQSAPSPGLESDIEKRTQVKREFEALRNTLTRLKTSTNDLARTSSQLVEDARLDTGTRLELASRLGELESASAELHDLIAAGLRN